MYICAPSPDGIGIHIWQAVFRYLGDVAVMGSIAGLCQNSVSVL